MHNPKTGGSRVVPDTRAENIDTYAETYTPEGGTQQSATYKIFNAPSIINNALDKLSFLRTHVAAVWYNKLANITLKQKLDEVDGAVGQLKDDVSEALKVKNVSYAMQSIQVAQKWYDATSPSGIASNVGKYEGSFTLPEGVVALDFTPSSFHGKAPANGGCSVSFYDSNNNVFKRAYVYKPSTTCYFEVERFSLPYFPANTPIYMIITFWDNSGSHILPSNTSDFVATIYAYRTL